MSFQPYYECHITCEKRDRNKEETVINSIKWRFSCIDGDPVLGKKPYSYATHHFPQHYGDKKVKQLLNEASQVLKQKGLDVIRSKIELVSFDTKNDSCIFEEYLNTQTVSDFIKEAHTTAIEKGWWEQPRSKLELLMLVVSELSEACEDIRVGKEETEELADVVIRLFDYCGNYNLDLEAAVIQKMEKNKLRAYRHGGKLL